MSQFAPKGGNRTHALPCSNMHCAIYKYLGSKKLREQKKHEYTKNLNQILRYCR